MVIKMERIKDIIEQKDNYFINLYANRSNFSNTHLIFTSLGMPTMEAYELFSEVIILNSRKTKNIYDFEVLCIKRPEGFIPVFDFSYDFKLKNLRKYIKSEKFLIRNHYKNCNFWEIFKRLDIIRNILKDFVYNNGLDEEELRYFIIDISSVVMKSDKLDTTVSEFTFKFLDHLFITSLQCNNLMCINEEEISEY